MKAIEEAERTGQEAGREERGLNRFELLLLRAKALLGDLEACHWLGAIYATGESPILENEELAVRWYSRAARKGHAESQYDLGWMYLLGEGVGRDRKEALRLLTAAAEAGYSEAMRVLVDLYSSGHNGVTADDMLAAEWTKRLSAHLERFPDDRRDYEAHSDS